MIFKRGLELKKYVSGIDATFDIENIENSIIQAQEDVTDYIGEALMDIAEEHYNSVNYNVADDQDAGHIRLNKLVDLIRAAVAPTAINYHFIWLAIRVSNSGITTVKSSNETAAYKYQTDEAKSQLLQQSYSAITRLLAFLNKEATPFTDFAPLTAYKKDAVCRNGSAFYIANADFTSTDTFDVNDWTEKPASEIIFKEWTDSEVRTMLNNLIFTDYKDFNRYYGIDNSAVFFVKARYIIEEQIDTCIRVRFQQGAKVQIPAINLSKVKRFLAYKVVSEAIMRLDVNYLPETLRGPISNEMNKKGGDVDYIREKLRANILNQANDYLKELDMELSSEKTATEAPLAQYQTNMNSDNNFVSMI